MRSQRSTVGEALAASSRQGRRPTDRLQLRSLGWVPGIAGAVGTVAGVIADLYSAEMRAALESTVSRFIASGSTIAIACFLSCVLTFFLCRRIFLAEEAASPVAKTLRIPAGPVASKVPDEDAVAGRSLKYYEAKRPTDELVVLIHGLGLDAADFRSYLNEGGRHAIALTLFGFDDEDRNNERYRPISLESHAELASFAIGRFVVENPGKRLVLVGFSLGADILMLLSQRWVARQSEAPPIHAILLLDPNINRSTMNISKAIASMDPDRPLEELKRLAVDTTTLVEFRNMCLYLYKITGKNLRQSSRFARDILQYWKDDSFDSFLDRMVSVVRMTSRVDIVFSAHYEQDFNSASRAAEARGLEHKLLDCAERDHFQLLDQEFLSSRIADLLKN